MLQYVMYLAADNTSPDVGAYLSKYGAQFGIFGLAFFDLLVTRKVLVPKWDKEQMVTAKDETISDRDKTIEEKNEDIKELKGSLAQLQTLTRDQILPALVRANQLSADYVQEITRRAYLDPLRRQREEPEDGKDAK